MSSEDRQAALELSRGELNAVGQVVDQLRGSTSARLQQALDDLARAERERDAALDAQVRLGDRLTETVVRLTMYRRDRDLIRAELASARTELEQLRARLGYDLALVPREDADEVEPALEPAPSSEAIASLLAIVDGPYRESGPTVDLEDA